MATRAKMRIPPLIAMLPTGKLHLQHGPIDLIIGADGSAEAREAAFRAASDRFATVLEELCSELSNLRAPAGSASLSGPVARRMADAVLPHASGRFITPMAAVAGAVADEMMDVMRGTPLRRAFVNNGGDIALYLAPGERFRVGLIDRPDQPGLFAATEITHTDPIRGIATSGWRGRSFSLGIADAVTVLASCAADADAAATVISNDVDLPEHPAIQRVPACEVQADTDLGARLVTRNVGPLRPDEIETALERGVRTAEALRQAGLIVAAALHCQGQTRIIGPALGLNAQERTSIHA